MKSLIEWLDANEWACLLGVAACFLTVCYLQNEYGAYGATIGICAGMIAALWLVAVIAILQGQDAKDEQRLREQVAEKSRMR